MNHYIITVDKLREGVTYSNDINKCVYHHIYDDLETGELIVYRPTSDTLSTCTIPVNYEFATVISVDDVDIFDNLDQAVVVDIDHYITNIRPNLTEIDLHNSVTGRCMILNTSASICLVGNSPINIGKKLGDQIDSHDIVVRFNIGGCKPPCTVNDYGCKTTIRVVNRKVTCCINNDMDQDVLQSVLKTQAFICSSDDAPLIENNNRYEKGFNHGKITKPFEDKYGIQFKYRSNNVTPTSGLIYLLVFLRFFPKIDVYGIDINEKPWNYSSVGNPIGGIYSRRVDLIDSLDVKQEEKREYHYYDHHIIKQLVEHGLVNVIVK